MIEHDRIAYVVQRDGIYEARAWARRTLAIYRAAIARKGDGRRTPYGQAYRARLVASCLVLRAALRAAMGVR